MCEFSHKGSVLVDIPYEQAKLGYRFFQSQWKEKNLKSLNREFEYISKQTESEYIPTLNSDVGIYSYNYYNYNYNNYNYYNYYNYNYNYNNYNYYNYYNYNNYNYYISAIVKSFNKIVVHTNRGFRAQSIEILALLSMKDNGNKKFLKHFNNHIDIVALKLGVPVIPWQNSEPIPVIE